MHHSKWSQYIFFSLVFLAPLLMKLFAFFLRECLSWWIYICTCYVFVLSKNYRLCWTLPQSCGISPSDLQTSFLFSLVKMMSVNLFIFWKIDKVLSRCMTAYLVLVTKHENCMVTDITKNWNPICRSILISWISVFTRYLC